MRKKLGVKSVLLSRLSLPDMDDSSVIDDEAEPGCPSRPTSPVLLGSTSSTIMSKMSLSPAPSPSSPPLQLSTFPKKPNGHASSIHPLNNNNNTTNKKKLNKNTTNKVSYEDIRLKNCDDLQHLFVATLN